MEKPEKINLSNLPKGMTVTEQIMWNKCCTLYDKYDEEREVDEEKIEKLLIAHRSLMGGWNAIPQERFNVIATALAEAMKEGELWKS